METHKNIKHYVYLAILVSVRMHDAPPNSLKNVNATPIMKILEKKSWGMFLNSQDFGGKRDVLDLWDGD
jgi:hypothetical protein